jgi:chromosome segregation ATPase
MPLPNSATRRISFLTRATLYLHYLPSQLRLRSSRTSGFEARISGRRRKLQESVVWLQEQRDRLKAQVLALEALLKRHGLEVPEYEFMGKQIHAAFEHKNQLAGESHNLPPNATEAQVKRLQKRIAARKLGSEIELLQEQMDHWKLQVLRFEGLLKQYGIECPESHS